jgi:glyoxylase-like metal-dependent hydrolase (beta-lactamase superfamily II)
MKYTFHIVDVFSSTPFGGNQLAVLPDAAGISTEGMQKIAREFNFGETTFVLPFLGLDVFNEAYPRVRIIANSAVVDRINKAYQEKIDKWQKILGPGATSHVVAIEKFDGNFIKFESSEIEVVKHIQGDTGENTMLWIPGQRTLIAGDVVINNMHVYTAETDSNARGKWLNSLNKIRELKPSVVIPGHSKVGAPLDANTAVDFTENYLLAFEEELKKAKDPDSLINTMKERFPSADFLLAIERGAKANVKP